MKAEQLIHFWNIGWSDSNDSTRNVGYDLPNHDWPWFVETYAKPILAKGFKRLELHNPFGCMPNLEMETTQWQQAERAGLFFLSRRFAEAWKPIVDSGIEVIAYLGTPSLDHILNDMRAKKQTDLYELTLQKAYAEPLEAGCSIAFDAMSDARAGDKSPDYDHMRELQKLGVKTYIEAWPPKVFPGLADCNVFTGSSFHPEVMRALQANEWPMPLEKMTGERIQILNSIPFEGESWDTIYKWLPKWVQDTIRTYGETPCFFTPQEFINSKQTIEEYFGL